MGFGILGFYGSGDLGISRVSGEWRNLIWGWDGFSNEGIGLLWIWVSVIGEYKR